MISIIIPCKGNEGFTHLCIQKIKQYTKVPYQVVIIDNSRDDKTRAVISPLFLPADVYLRNYSPMSFAKSCNVGAKLAEGDVLCFLNNDCEVKQGWDEAILKGLETAELVGPSLMKVDVIHKKKRFACAGRTNSMEGWTYLEGWCLGIKKDVFLEVGGFDERFTPYFCEDTDLSFTVKAKGLRIKKIDIPIQHYGHGTVKMENSFDIAEADHRNNTILYEKWKPEKVPLLSGKANTILIQRWGGLGDVLLCQPIVRELRRRYPKAKITFETYDLCREIIENFTEVNEVVRNGSTNEANYDIFLKPEYEVVGVSNYAIELAASVDLEGIDTTISFYVSESYFAWAQEVISSLPEVKIAFHTGLTWKNRTWPLKSFERLARALHEKGYGTFCIGRGDSPYTPDLGIDLRGKVVAETAALIKAATFFVGIDSFPLHLAGAVGTPVVGIYGCTDPNVVWNKGPHYPVWNEKLECKGCRHKSSAVFVDCPKKTYECLATISPEIVMGKIEECLRDIYDGKIRVQGNF